MIREKPHDGAPLASPPGPVRHLDGRTGAARRPWRAALARSRGGAGLSPAGGVALGLATRRFSVRTALPVEEVERRVAAATERWREEGFGTPAARPPWQGGAFVATTGSPGLSLLPFVLEGTVRAGPEGTRIDAVVRPHRAIVVALGLYVAFAAAALLGTDATGRAVLAGVAVASWFALRRIASDKAAAIRRVLEDACDAS